MASKKGQHIDVLGESFLPEDLFTSTEGSNWGLDGYPDLAYGAGVIDAQVLGDSTLEPSLPDGLVRKGEQEHEFDDMGDLGFMHEASITDLSWLDLAEQDPDRLPENPVALSVPELEEAWGMDRVTDGIHLMPNLDREIVNYRNSLEQDKTASTLSRKQIQEVSSYMGRRIASGVSLKQVWTDVHNRLGGHVEGFKPYLDQAKDDEGLLGRVYLRASHYPGCASGRWSKAVQKHASARYMVQKKACGGCVHAQDGSCSIFKKELVASVPWDQALNKYTPILTASGRTLVAGNAKDVLRKAFAQAPRGMDRISDTRPINAHAADSVTIEQAQTTLANTQVHIRKLDAISAEKRMAAIEVKVAKIQQSVENGLRGTRLVNHIAAVFSDADRPLALGLLDPYLRSKNAFQESLVARYSGSVNDTRQVAASGEQAWDALRKAAMPTVIDLADYEMAKRERQRVADHQANVKLFAQWRNAGALSQAQFEKLATSRVEKDVLYKLALSLVSDQHKASILKLSSSSYVVKGKVAKEQPLSYKEAWAALDKAEKSLREKEASIRETVEDRYIQGRVAKVVDAIQRGLKGTMLQRFIQRTLAASDILRASPYLNPILRETKAHLEPKKVTQQYDGAKYHAVQAKKASQDVSTLETRRMLRWARQQMSEGFAGHELDQLIENRFAESVIQAAQTEMKQIRLAHEGLSGHAYVDVAAYASANGITGCEKAAPKHRANSIPTLLQMDRCGSCTSRSMRNDGVMSCRVFNKPLIQTASEIVDGDPKVYQKEMIRLANGTDADRVASLFAPSYTNDYGLGQGEAEMDNIPIEDEVHDSKLAGVFYGGMYL